VILFKTGVGRKTAIYNCQNQITRAKFSIRFFENSEDLKKFSGFCVFTIFDKIKDVDNNS